MEIRFCNEIPTPKYSKGYYPTLSNALAVKIYEKKKNLLYAIVRARYGKEYEARATERIARIWGPHVHHQFYVWDFKDTNAELLEWLVYVPEEAPENPIVYVNIPYFFNYEKYMRLRQVLMED